MPARRTRSGSRIRTDPLVLVAGFSLFLGNFIGPPLLSAVLKVVSPFEPAGLTGQFVNRFVIINAIIFLALTNLLYIALCLAGIRLAAVPFTVWHARLVADALSVRSCMYLIHWMRNERVKYDPEVRRHVLRGFDLLTNLTRYVAWQNLTESRKYNAIIRETFGSLKKKIREMQLSFALNRASPDQLCGQLARPLIGNKKLLAESGFNNADLVFAIFAWTVFALDLFFDIGLLPRITDALGRFSSIRRR